MAVYGVFRSSRRLGGLFGGSSIRGNLYIAANAASTLVLDGGGIPACSQAVAGRIGRGHPGLQPLDISPPLVVRSGHEDTAH